MLFGTQNKVQNAPVNSYETEILFINTERGNVQFIVLLQF